MGFYDLVHMRQLQCLATTYSSSASAIVPLAQSSFTAEFGMGSGGALTQWSPSNEAGAYTWDFNRCFDVSGWLNHRSEEHTSELQSLMRISYAVFCLKKKII